MKRFFCAAAVSLFIGVSTLAADEYEDGSVADPAAKIMLSQARGGNGDAILRVAVAYAAGDKGFPKDPRRAVLWWKKGADMGDARSQNYLASAYLKGEGVAPNPKAAVELWEKAASLGFPEDPMACQKL